MSRRFHMRFRRSAATTTAVLVAASLALAACGSTTAASGKAASGKQAITVGYDNSLSGTYAGIGQPELGGMQTCIDAANSAGGVAGHKINLVVKDDGGEGATAISNFKSFEASNVVAVMGGVLSTAADPMAPLAKAAKIPLIATAFTSAQLLPPSPYLYGDGVTAGGNAVMELELVKQLEQSGKIKAPARVAVITINTEYTLAQRKDIHALASRYGANIVSDVVVPASSVSLATQAAQIAASRPSAVIGSLLDTQAPSLVSSLAADGSTPYVINYIGGSATSTFSKIASPKFLAFTEAAPTTVPVADSMIALAKKYGQSGQATNPFFTLEYGGCQALVHALKVCGPTCTAQKLPSALESLHNFSTGGLMAPITLSKTQHEMDLASQPYQWDASKNTITPAGPFDTYHLNEAG